MNGEPLGRVAITWPAAHNPPNALPVWGIAFDDPDSGEQLVDVVGLRMELGSEVGWPDTRIEVVLTRLVDADGKPVGTTPNRLVFTDEYAEWLQNLERTAAAVFPGQKFRTGQFRYVVAEMRLAASAPGSLPRKVATARLAHGEATDG